MLWYKSSQPEWAQKKPESLSIFMNYKPKIRKRRQKIVNASMNWTSRANFHLCSVVATTLSEYTTDDNMNTNQVLAWHGTLHIRLCMCELADRWLDGMLIVEVMFLMFVLGAWLLWGRANFVVGFYPSRTLSYLPEPRNNQLETNFAYFYVHLSLLKIWF